MKIKKNFGWLKWENWLGFLHQGFGEMVGGGGDEKKN